MADFQPTPSYALPFIATTPEGQEFLEKAGVAFNPQWLRWFLSLIETLNEAGGVTLQHNMLTGLQGGTTDEFYHLTQAQDTAIAGLFGNQSANTVYAGPTTGAAAPAAFRALVTADLAAKIVTYAKIQDETDATLLGRSAGSAGAPMEITTGAGLTLTSGVLNTAVSTASSTYTPTLTNVANLDSSSANPCQYLQVGSTVAVSGSVVVDPTVIATFTQLGISLPIASNFANDYEAAGTGSNGALLEPAAILADTTNDRAELEFLSAVNTSHTIWFSFIYRVI